MGKGHVMSLRHLEKERMLLIANGANKSMRKQQYEDDRIASAIFVLWGLSVLSILHVVFPLEISAKEVLVCICLRAIT